MISRLLLVALLFCSFAQSQITSWLPTGYQLDWYTNDFYEDTSDKSLYVGGYLHTLNGLKCNGVFRIDSNVQIDYLDTLSIIDQINSIEKYKGDIYASGWRGLFCLKNGNWVDISNAVQGNIVYYDAEVYNNALILAGRHTSSSNPWQGALIRYDGLTVSSVFSGIDTLLDTTNNPAIGPLAVHDNKLFVSGEFNYPGFNDIASWDGTKWDNLNGGLMGFDVWIEDIVSYQNDVFVAGVFHKKFGSQANHIMKWDGESWQEVHTGIEGVQVHGMKVFHNKLWVVGNFEKAGNIDVNHIAVWDGMKWCKPYGELDHEGVLSAAGSHRDTLLIGGSFKSINGDSSISNIAKMNASIPLSCDSTVGFTESINEELHIKIFPNPLIDNTLYFTLPVNQFHTIQVFNLFGKEVIKRELNQDMVQSLTLPENTASGYYLIQFLGNENVHCEKLLVE